jgi:hypothetical protein
MSFAIGDIVWITNNSRGDDKTRARHYQVTRLDSITGGVYQMICIKIRETDHADALGFKCYPSSGNKIEKVRKRKWNHPLTPIFA